MRKILFLSYDFPFPVTSGGKNRAYHMLKFGSSDLEIHLWSYIREDFNTSSISEIQKLGIKHIRTFMRRGIKDPLVLLSNIYPFSSVFKNLYFDKKLMFDLRNYIVQNNIDVVHCESFYTAYFIDESLRKLGIKLVFGTENIEYLIYKDQSKYVTNPIIKAFYMKNALNVRNEEERIAKLSDAVIAVNEKEASYFNRVSGKPTYIVENGVDEDYFSFRSKKAGGKKLLYVGNFSYVPNIDAMKFFVSEVMPDIADRRVQLFVVGKGVGNLEFLKDLRIVKKEYVRDIREMYYESDVFISPLRIGGGTNFKLLEAMACGLPIVTLSHRATDVGLRDKFNAIVVNDANSMKLGIESIFSNRELVGIITKNARKLVEEKYSWKRIGKRLNEIWKTI